MSAIGKTASISLCTAVPGSGKSLRAVWYCVEAIKAGEQVYACNINGLRVEGVNDFPDPTKWEDLPPGSILIVDEAQKFFRAGREVPEYIKEMETIRHRGIRLLLLTQHPTLIHANIRALVGYHEHLVRVNGKEAATVYSRSRIIDNVRSDKGLAAEDHHEWPYPKDCYKLYDSAEVHTVKRTVPYKYKRAVIMAVVAAAILGGVVWQMNRAVHSGSAGSSQAAAAGAATRLGGGLGIPEQEQAKPRWETASDYARDHLARFPSMPWTAPVFDDRAITADPQLMCMSAAPGHLESGVAAGEACVCFTEQGTTYDMPHSQCLRTARQGPPYNPYKQGMGQMPPSVPAAYPAAVASGPSVAVGIGDPLRPVHPQGAFRGERTGPDKGYELQGW